jgi:hypothetical protein
MASCKKSFEVDAKNLILERKVPATKRSNPRSENSRAKKPRMDKPTDEDCGVNKKKKRQPVPLDNEGTFLKKVKL